MNKAIKLIPGFLLFYLVSALSAQGLNIRMNLPERVNAGSEFEVKLTIEKGTLSDYARFSQELPYGLTATNVRSPNADFSFEEQRVRIIWLKLPEGNTINVIYKVHVDERLKGTFSLDGNFAYVVNEERNYTEIEPSGAVTIIPNPAVSQASLIDIKNFKSVLAGSAVSEAEKSYVTAIRQKPVQMSDGSVFIQLLIKNPEGSKYAKIEETIPSGYIFEEVENQQGIVSFSASQVKYIWMRLPGEPEFMISYKLIPKMEERQEAMNVTGVFTYTVGNSSFEDPVIEIDANLDELSVLQKRNLLLTGVLPEDHKPLVADLKEQPIKEKVTEKQPEYTETPVSESKFIQGTKVITPEKGICFRIQLIALRMPFNGNLHFSRLGIDGDIRVEIHEGLYKYSAGSFSDYLSASRYKKTIENRPGLDDAFIVAYRNGMRISIEEALRYSD
ncbi:MAG TPA: hypothetical protein ENN61_00960 [Bacteroidaceae bacterium]|nr:hypothetical protein [Bacteroidaceae bacterium]